MFDPEMDSIPGGVYIYQNRIDPSKAYRIYNEFGYSTFNGYNDEKMISKMIERQPNIKLTDLPTGIVTLNDRIIGQEIKYYANSKTVYEYSKNPIYDDVSPTQLNIEILNAIKELHDNGIFYYDTHPKNFMLVKNEEDSALLKNIVKTIDFDPARIDFDEMTQSKKIELLSNIRKCINILNESFNIVDVVGKLPVVDSISELEEAVHEQDEKFKKSKR